MTLKNVAATTGLTLLTLASTKSLALTLTDGGDFYPSSVSAKPLSKQDTIACGIIALAAIAAAGFITYYESKTDSASKSLTPRQPQTLNLDQRFTTRPPQARTVQPSTQPVVSAPVAAAVPQPALEPQVASQVTKAPLKRPSKKPETPSKSGLTIGSYKFRSSSHK